ncbi:MAG: pyruvate, phosphate dikinase [Nitrospirae bacterium]|nr:pyruvate, phosphate dikinase [Nitrospirota bacterium]
MKYNAYKSLITHNTSSLSTLSGLELLLRDIKPFTLDYFVLNIESLIVSVENIVKSLNELCAGKYQELFHIVENIGGEVLGKLKRPRTFESEELVLPLESLCRERLNDVGGKAANFGEIHNSVKLPVPHGFSITAYACYYFLKSNGLIDQIAELIRGLRVEDTESLTRVSDEIKSLIMNAALPPDLEQAILDGAKGLNTEAGPDLRLSVRSSATCEDSEASFAGQYSSVLNVSCNSILEAYKEVVASTFSPRAIFYRRNKGYAEDDIIMSVLCLSMVNSVKSGVMYTVDPTDHNIKDVIISAAWGLGVSVVDGSSAVDLYRVGKVDGKIKMREIAGKMHRIVMASPEGLRSEDVPSNMRNAPCLSDEEIRQLMDYGTRLENHYGEALDIEWAVDQDGRLLVLQARALNPMTVEADAGQAELPSEPNGASTHPVLLEGGHCASPGVATGIAYVVTSDRDLSGVAEGAILIGPQTSPAFVSIMGRLRGIITDLGSITGHMAAVAREFDLPALVATDRATRVIPNGEEITLDSSRRTVYKGRVESLLKEKKKANPMEGSPVFTLAREAVSKIAPLTLTDPYADNFNPRGCRTIHDIIRLGHEISMREMFRIGDYLDDDEGKAIRLRVNLPMVLYCVDLGGGMRLDPGKIVATTEDLTSTPFTALINGMTHKDIKWVGGVGMSVGDMASLFAHSMIYDPTTEGRFGGPSYAVISKEYLNFNSRLGYHFAVVDSYCGPEANENYITFSFKGGAANMRRRERRAMLIAVILERLGMTVDRNGDMVRGEIRECKAEQLIDKLDHLGRLMGAMRLVDMAITDDSQIAWYADEFFKGNYSFGKE